MTGLKHSYLGANTPLGFFSLYENMLENAGKSWIIKGSPGCGKSTFMKHIAKSAEKKGMEAQLFRCSSDPFSLDGLCIPAIDTAYVDGTSPHALEPDCPGAVGNYVNLGQFVDHRAIRHEKGRLIPLFESCRSCYPKAYSRLKTARDLLDDNLGLVCQVTDFQRLSKRIRGIISREIGKPAKARGRLYKRFLSSISFEGYCCDFCEGRGFEKIYCLQSSHELGRFATVALMEASLAAGFDTVACYSPMNPLGPPEHVFIPTLSLAFLSSSPELQYLGNYCRKVRLDGCVGDLGGSRERIRFNRKTASCLILEAVESLNEAKVIHDQIEAVYRPYIDFDGVMALAEKHADELA